MNTVSKLLIGATILVGLLAMFGPFGAIATVVVGLIGAICFPNART